MPWDFPFWIAHRGAGKLAPENTLAAFRLGANHGYRAFECDVKLSADGVIFLLHDATLTRTTSAHKQWAQPSDTIAGNHPWHALSQLDAGTWHSRAYAGEPMPTLDAIAHYCQANGARLNIEIKPTPGQDAATGAAVANACARLWAGRSDLPLLSSFQIGALESAQSAQANMPRALLMDVFQSEWLAHANRLGCRAVVFNYALWDVQRVEAAHAAGMKAMSYTVNDEWAVAHLKALGTDGIITDRVDAFTPQVT